MPTHGPKPRSLTVYLGFFLTLTSLLSSSPSRAQQKAADYLPSRKSAVYLPSKNPALLLKGSRSRCMHHEREFKGIVTSGGKALESANVYLAPKGVPLARSKVINTDQRGRFLLCVQQKARYRLTVLARAHERFTRLLSLAPKALPELTIELSPMEGAQPDGCQKQGGWWWCNGNICPPQNKSTRGQYSVGLEHCQACCMPGVSVPCSAKRTCPCTCLFSNPFSKGHKKKRKQSR